jgi:uncharacterized membrane protein
MAPRRVLARVGIALAVGALAYLLARTCGPACSVVLPPLVGWDAAGVALLSLSWAGIIGADAVTTHERAASEDPGRTLVYVTVVVTSAASLVGATMLVHSARGLPDDLRLAAVGLCLLTVALAWTMTHTAFTYRYAHLYYREDKEGVGGIELPGGQPPTYSDFAYFAFTIGMCFQVSDACVSSRQIRRTVLLHAVVSFAYNSTILAFVLSLVFAMAG